MRLVHNTAIRFAAATVCVIAALLSAVLTLITNVIALFLAPAWIAVYSAVFAWTGDEDMSLRWEMHLRRVQTIFALPAATVAAVASMINDSLRLKIR